MSFLTVREVVDKCPLAKCYNFVYMLGTKSFFLDNGISGNFVFFSKTFFKNSKILEYVGITFIGRKKV